MNKEESKEISEATIDILLASKNPVEQAQGRLTNHIFERVNDWLAEEIKLGTNLEVLEMAAIETCASLCAGVLGKAELHAISVAIFSRRFSQQFAEALQQNLFNQYKFQQDQKDNG